MGKLPTVAKVNIGSVPLGDDAVRIIVPLLGAGLPDVCSHAAALAGSQFDIAEWRIDHLRHLDSLSALDAAAELSEGAQKIRDLLGGAPLIVTYRTSCEGGMGQRGDAAYGELLQEIVSARIADGIDVEIFRDPSVVSAAIASAQGAGVPVIGSFHDFEKTPPQPVIVSRLRAMQDDYGADVLKIAVTPKDPGDVLELLAATWEMRSQYASRPLITVSMGESGVLSRIGGHAFGSAATFGAARVASAPGQVAVKELRDAAALIPFAHCEECRV